MECPLINECTFVVDEETWKSKCNTSLHKKCINFCKQTPIDWKEAAKLTEECKHLRYK
jgi:hypothetical protein